MLKLLLLGLASSAAGFSPTATPAARQLRHGAAKACSAPAMLADGTSPQPVGRRNMLGLTAGLALGACLPQAAVASGGATAGKYTTIPIAKRRYFGRVKQGVYEFTLVGAAIKKVRGACAAAWRVSVDARRARRPRVPTLDTLAP